MRASRVVLKANSIVLKDPSDTTLFIANEFDSRVKVGKPAIWLLDKKLRDNACGEESFNGLPRIKKGNETVVKSIRCTFVRILCRLSFFSLS